MVNILVRLVDVVDRDNGQMAVVTEITKSDAATRYDTDLVDLLLGDIEGNGHGEQGAVRKADVLDNTNSWNQISVFCGLGGFFFENTYPL